MWTEITITEWIIIFFQTHAFVSSTPRTSSSGHTQRSPWYENDRITTILTRKLHLGGQSFQKFVIYTYMII